MDNRALDTLMRDSVMKAQELDHEYTTIEHLAYCLLTNKTIVKFLNGLDIDLGRI